MPNLARIAEPLKAFIEAMVGRRLDYYALYPCSVVSQSGNELEVVPDDARVKGFGLGSIPIKVGLPGYEVEVPEGARVLLGFEAGDPKRPYCAIWESATDVDQLTFDSGSEDVARTNDDVDAGYLVFHYEIATGYLYGDPAHQPLYFPGGPIGQAAATAAKNAIDQASPPALTDGLLISLNQGIITSGNTKLKA